MKYDIKKMTIVQFLEFLLLSIVGVPIHLFLSVFVFVGAKMGELDEIVKNYVFELAEKWNFPVKEDGEQKDENSI
jgi:hypothetical protein